MIPELLTRAQADALMAVVAVFGVALAFGGFIGARRRGGKPVSGAMLWGGPPLLAALLWPVYNVVTDRIGLDRMANVYANLALFVAVGAGAGLAWRAVARGEKPRKDTGETAPKA